MAAKKVPQNLICLYLSNLLTDFFHIYTEGVDYFAKNCPITIFKIYDKMATLNLFFL